MNPQEQNKAVITPGIQKSESPKQPVAANALPGATPADKEADECSTTKGSCGTK